MDRVPVTRTEVAGLLDPPMTVPQVAALIAATAIEPVGKARTARPGRPAYLYDQAAITEAHAIEAARTSKGFADNDWIASALLARGLIIADPVPGVLCWPDGSRAEHLDCSNAYGMVKVGGTQIMAHRVIWIAAEGEIPFGIQINHRNLRRWDNRLANLELVTMRENIRHGTGRPYLARAEAVSELAEHRSATPALAAPAVNLVRAGAIFRKPSSLY